MRGWVLFGGHLGGRSETTSDSRGPILTVKGSILCDDATTKKTLTSNLSPLHGCEAGAHTGGGQGQGKRQGNGSATP